MKNLIYIFLIFLAVACQKNQSANNSILEKYSYKHEKSSYKSADKTNGNIKDNSLLELQKEFPDDKLIGLIIIDSTATSDSKRFGLDISNACYACNLGTLKISKDKIYIENYCDSKEVTTFKIIKVVKTEKPFKAQIITEDATLTFKKDENSLYYTLSVEGKLNTPLIISQFYTSEVDLPSFFIHDCQNFEG